MKKVLFTLTLSVAAMALIGCSNDITVGPAQEATPTLPATASMEVPQFCGTAPQALTKSQLETTIAFDLASVAVHYWRAAVQLGLATPVALFQLCHSVTPTALPDESGWVWMVGNAQANATLTGRVAGDSVRWSMSVTGDNLTDFVWFDGTSTITGKSGYWTFYDTSLVGGVHPASLVFSYADGADFDEVKVEIVNPADSSFGNYLSFEAEGTARTFTAYDAEPVEMIVIGWDAITEAGYVQNQTKNEIFYWDTKANGHVDRPTPAN